MTAPSGALPARAWLIVAVLWVVALLNYLDRLMITSMRDPIKASIAMTDAQFGLLTSVFLFVYGALSPFGGFLADRFGRSRVIFASLFVWSAVTWLTGHVHTINEMLLARGLMGISEACYVPAALALIADYHRGRTRSLATGLHISGVYAGGALGGVGGFLAEHAGWRFGFSLFGVVGIAYAFVVMWVVRDAPPHVPSPEEEHAPIPASRPVQAGDILRGLFTQPAFWVLLTINALTGLANWVVGGWMPTYLREQFHLGLGAAGMSATAYAQFAAFAGVLGGGMWADRWSRRNPRGRAYVPAIGYLMAGPGMCLAASTGSLPIAIAGLILFGLGRGSFDANNMPILRQITDERFSATGYGILNLVGSVTGGLMIYVGGRLKDAQFNLAWIFQVAAVGLVIVGLLLLAVKRTPTKFLS